MAVHELNLQSLLRDLDGGRVNEAFMQELKHAAMDCEDRSGDRNPRRVMLEVKLMPICDEEGRLDSVSGKFHITSKVPARRSKVYSFGYRRGGQLVFNDLSDDNVHQRTVDELLPEPEELEDDGA